MIGEVLTRCVAADVVRRCGDAVRSLARSTYGPDAAIPEIAIEGHLDANFPYIQSHLEYIVGELLRNSVQAVIERQARLRESRKRRAGASAATADDEPPPIEVTVCEAQQHVIIRVSDRGGGVPRDVLPHLWSFSRGGSAAAREARLRNLAMVPKMAATLQEVRVDDDHHRRRDSKDGKREGGPAMWHGSGTGSLSSLSSRPPNLRLGMGLPLSRVYAEYWAGTLELHSLEGYGVDAFLQISRLGNKNEQLTTRASMDAV